MKKTKTIKRLFSSALIFLLSINCFAAVISDNDGSAFITKGEFDSLKNDFASQIKQYENSIDSKTDGAIAQYLSGVVSATATSYTPLVTNYTDIRWMDAHKMKLEYYTYNSATSKTAMVAPAYMTPIYHEHRNVRGGTMIINDMLFNDFMAGLCKFDGILETGRESVESKIHMYAGAYVGNGAYNQAGVPVLKIIERRNDDSGKYYIEGMANESSVQNAMHGLTHQPQSASQLYRLSTLWSRISNNAWKINTPASGEFWNYYLKFDNGVYFTSSMKANNTWYGAPFGDRTIDQKYSNATTTLNDSIGKYKYPVYWQESPSANQANNDLSNLYYLMLGTDDDQTVNVIRYYTSVNVCDGKFYDWSDSTTVTTQFWPQRCFFVGGGLGSMQAGTMNWANYTDNNNVDMSVGNTVSFPLGVPLLPRKQLRKEYTGKFKNAATGLDLSIGAGLPIVNNLSSDQTINFEFDFEKVNTEYSVSASEGANKYINVDVKKTDFENTSMRTDFWKGQVDGGAEQELKNVKIDNTSTNKGHAEFSVPCKAGDSIWIRIKTNGATAGYYTKMTNLKITGISGA